MTRTAPPSHAVIYHLVNNHIYFDNSGLKLHLRSVVTVVEA